jgi:hypothetical protein
MTANCILVWLILHLFKTTRLTSCLWIVFIWKIKYSKVDFLQCKDCGQLKPLKGERGKIFDQAKRKCTIWIWMTRFSCIRKIANIYCWLQHVCLFPCTHTHTHWITLITKDGISWNFIFEYFQKSVEKTEVE